MKKLLIIMFDIITIIMVSGCGKKLPSTDFLKTDLVGKKIGDGTFQEEIKIDEIKNLKVTASQDNYKKDKTAEFLANIEFVNNHDKVIIECELSINYKCYDDGGWKFSRACIKNEDAAIKKLSFEVTDKEVFEKLPQVPYSGSDGGVIIPGTEFEKNKGYYYFNKDDVKSAKVINKTLDTKLDNYNVEMEISAENKLIKFNGKYEGIIDLEYPGWSLQQLKPVEQKVTYTIPNTFTGKYYGSDSGTITVDLTKDIGDNTKEGTVTFNIKRFFATPAKGSYKVTAKIDNEKGTIYLKAGEWIEKFEEWVPDDFDLKIDAAYSKIRGDIISTRDGSRLGQLDIDVK